MGALWDVLKYFFPVRVVRSVHECDQDAAHDSYPVLEHADVYDGENAERQAGTGGFDMRAPVSC